ncbi:hypothetical protein ES332_D10G280800v1, partial [Gossypium tomentosum]
MELPKMYFEASNSFFLVYLQVIILLSYCNLQGLNMLCLATKSPVIRGNVTDQLALLQFKAKITGDQLKIMESWNSSSHFCQWRCGVTCYRKHQRVTKLELQFLELPGSLSPYIGNLSFLKGLNLANNNFYNQIPQEFGRLRRLETLELSNNSLSGEIPSNLSACSMLTFVHMRSNQLKGEIPASLGLLSNLIDLRFYNNSLTGSIPPSLGNLSSLKELHLALNGLTGNIPETLVRLTNLSFFSIGGNAIFEYLYIRKNNFGGVFPDCVSNFSSTIMFLAVGWNKILGRIPDGIENLINLEVLEASGNELLGHVPFGVGRLHKLKKFYADSNFLSGIIPHSIGNLTMLMELALDINNLQGDIPSSLSKCQNLLLMGLSNNILSGPIPGEVIGLQSLSISLDLSSNYLTGKLPVEVGKLKNLGKFSVSQNRCVSLEHLFLDANLFEGSIPASLSLLRGLEALDVSDNNLSGGVPEFLVSFGALKYLNLSFNKFNGVIPSEGVFKNASATFVEGNNKLCGGIPELHLSRCNAKTSSNTYVKLTIAIVVVILGVTLKERKKPTCAENSLLQLSYQSILRATNEFSAQNLIGSGSFGSVYKGILEVNGEAIAVKVFNLLNRGASRSLLAECEALRNIRHRNLVKAMTLKPWFISSWKMEAWRSDVAHALEYLHHCCETSIIHCDLKPSNILLDKEMVGHLSDFGLAKILSTDRLNYSSSQSSSLGLRGTIGYAPPEYAMGSELSTKGDVYSYGILLLEMFTGKRPTDERFKEGSNLYQFVKAALPDRVIEITDPILLQERVRRGIVRDITLNVVNLENDRRLHCLNLIFKIGLTCSVESRSERMDMR